MCTSLNIIGDIAGEFNTLMALLGKMPPGAVPVSVGDQIDRGPKSKDVLDFFMENGMAVLGNHCHMMLDEIDYIRSVVNNDKSFHKYYEDGLWQWNGGTATIKSFMGDKLPDSMFAEAEEILKVIPDKYIEYIRNLPLYLHLEVPSDDNKFDDLLITHAPKCPSLTLEKACELGDGFFRPSGKFRHMDYSVIWNRGRPKRIAGTFQVFGHNSQVGFHEYADGNGKFAVCLDDSKHEVLTGIHWPSMQVYQQEFIR